MNRPLSQKTIGMLGGMSDKATAEYYRMINQHINDRLGNWDIAETLIQGVNFGNIEYFIRNNEWDEARAYLEKKALLAEQGGADIILCVSNTMHKVLDNLANVISIPFLHIAEPTGKAIVAKGLTKIGLLGTKPVMSDSYIVDYYQQHFGLEVLVPSETDQVDVDRIIFDELVKGDIFEESKQCYLAICERLRANGAQGVILGCTEIFLLIKQSDIENFPLFNTTELHAKSAADFVLENLTDQG